MRLGQGESFDVVLPPDGTGLRDVAVTALLHEWPPGLDYGILVPPPPKQERRVPMANVRVTVRCENAADRSR